MKSPNPNDAELDCRLLERFCLTPGADPRADAQALMARGGGLGDPARREDRRLAVASGAYVHTTKGEVIAVAMTLTREHQEPDPELSDAELAQHGAAYLAYASGDADLAERQRMLREYWAPRWAREKAAAWAVRAT